MMRLISGLGLLSASSLTLLAGLAWVKSGAGAPLLHLGTLTLLALLALTGFAAYNTLCAALFARPALGCREQLQKRPLRCFLWGLLLALVQLWAILHAPWLAVVSLLVNALWLSFSLPALAGLAGEGLGVSGRWAPTAGSLPLCLTLAFPVLGWLCLVQLLLAGLGSATLPAAWQR